MIKRIGSIFEKSENDWLKVTVSIFFSIIMVIFFGKTVADSYALPTELPDTLTSGSTGNPADFVDLYRSELIGNETLNYQPFYATDSVGNKYVVYCLEKEKGWINGATITKSTEPLDAGYTYIIQNGYNGNINPNLTTNNAKNDEYLTKIAIWWYQDRSNGIDDNTDGVLTANQKNVIKNGNSIYYNYINTLVEGALNAKNDDQVDPTFTLAEINSNCHYSYNSLLYDKENHVFKSRIYRIKSNISYDSYQVIIDNNPNVKIYLEDGTLVNSGDTINASKSFYLQIDDDYASSIDSVSFSVNISYTKYNVYKYVPENENMQEGVVAVPEAVTMNKAVEESIIMPTRNLTINKTDTEGKLLSGAHLIIYNLYNGEKVADFTTDGSNYTVNGLVPGTYVIDEVEAPAGYYPTISNELKDLKLPDGTTFKNPVAKYEIDDFSVLTNMIHQVSGCIENVDNVDLYDLMRELNNLKNNNVVDITNSKYEVKIRKVDSDTGNPVSGAILNIINSDNEVVDTVTTGDDYVDVDVSKLKAGTYKVVEVSAPDGYYVNDKEKSFIIDKNHTRISVDFEDEKNEVIIEKKDVNNDKLISGATLRFVRVSDNHVIDEWTTNNKEHSIKGLEKGDYKVVEVKAPNGYTLSTSEVPVTIKGDETEPITVTFYNSNNGVIINKVDENGIPLSGAKLKVTNSNGDEIKTFTTTDSPYTLKKLSPGTYTIEEIEAPSGYKKSTTKESFVIDQNTTSLQVTFKNEKTEMYLGKVDSTTGEYIAGATLRLTDSKGDEVETFTSSNNPYKIEGLPYGKYHLEEVKAPTGYIKTDKKLEFDFNANSDPTFVYTISNKTGRLTIEKIDSETKSIINGVTLEIRNSSGDVVKTVTTTNRPVVISDLSEGTYKIVEINTPNGYIKSNKEYEVTINDNNPNPSVTIENKPIIVNLGKIDAITGKYIAGATLKLSRLDGIMEPITFVSTDSPYKVERLTLGLYALEEIETPAGYIETGSIVTFRVLETGKVQNVNISNNITTISVNNKVLTVDTGGVSGYNYRLETRDGRLIDEFTIGAEAYNSDTLDLGDYTLKQIGAPDGVIVNNNPIYFSVTDSNEVNVINFVNDFTKVTISKKDMANSEEIEGAHLIIRDGNGQIVEEWTSSDNPHYIEKLPVGKYTLTETIAPDGYILNTSTIEFGVKSTGDIQNTTMFNSRLVKAPNTSSNSTYIYLVGAILIVIGSILMYISYNNKIKIKSR